MNWLAASFTAAGDQVCLVTWLDSMNDRYFVDPGVLHYSFERKRYFNSSRISAPMNWLRWQASLRRIARQEHVDVVLSFIDVMNLSVLAAFAGTGLPVVVSERTNPRHSPLGWFWRAVRPAWYRRLATLVVVQRGAIGTWMKAQWGLGNVRVIPNAVLVGRRTPNPVESRQLLILSVGRLAHDKAYDVLIDAWALLANEFPEWRVRIAGEGPERTSLERDIGRGQLSGSVALPGWCADVAAEYAAASIFVLPSRVEGFPNALLEAMVAGCAVIASESAGASVDLIEHGVNGLLCPGESPESLATALRRFITDAALREQCAMRATRIDSQFSQRLVFGLWREVMSEAAAARRRAVI